MISDGENLVFLLTLLYANIRNLIMPLRASNINYSDLRHIVLVGNLQFLARWPLDILRS